MNINKFFALAKSASANSDFDISKSRHMGCVFVYKNRVVSIGWNTGKEHPAQKKYNVERGFDCSGCKNSLHAEMYALVKCQDLDIDWNRVSVFVYRELANGYKANSKPCLACQKAMFDKGIKLENIFYTNLGSYCRMGD